jgi:hypothetical protein
MSDRKKAKTNLRFISSRGYVSVESWAPSRQIDAIEDARVYSATEETTRRAPFGGSQLTSQNCRAISGRRSIISPVAAGAKMALSRVRQHCAYRYDPRPKLTLGLDRIVTAAKRFRATGGTSVGLSPLLAGKMRSPALTIASEFSGKSRLQPGATLNYSYPVSENCWDQGLIDEA